MGFRITSLQRDNIVRLLKKSDQFDDRTVTYQHRRLGAPDRFLGRPVTEWLDSLTLIEGTRMIDQLREWCDEVEEEDED